MFQRHTVQELHHEEGLAVLLPDFVDRADIGMVQRRSRLRLPLKTGEGLWVSGYFIGQKFQRDKPVQGYVFGLVHNPHAAATQLLNDVLVRDGTGNHRCAGTLGCLMVGPLHQGSQRACCRVWPDNALAAASSTIQISLPLLGRTP
jgi:hypothetical protein